MFSTRASTDVAPEPRRSPARCAFGARGLRQRGPVALTAPARSQTLRRAVRHQSTPADRLPRRPALLATQTSGLLRHLQRVDMGIADERFRHPPALEPHDPIGDIPIAVARVASVLHPGPRIQGRRPGSAYAVGMACPVRRTPRLRRAAGLARIPAFRAGGPTRCTPASRRRPQPRARRRRLCRHPAAVVGLPRRGRSLCHHDCDHVLAVDRAAALGSTRQ